MSKEKDKVRIRWDIDVVCGELLVRGLQPREMSPTHFKVTLPLRGEVDFWPTTGKWHSLGRMHGHAMQGEHSEFFKWLDEVVATQRAQIPLETLEQRKKLVYELGELWFEAKAASDPAMRTRYLEVYRERLRELHEIGGFAGLIVTTLQLGAKGASA